MINFFIVNFADRCINEMIATQIQLENRLFLIVNLFTIIHRGQALMTPMIKLRLQTRRTVYLP